MIDYQFVLDIGTRFVRGFLCVLEKEKLIVKYAEIIEHQERAMISGQIHHIDKVTDVVKQIKEKLEKEASVVLTRVACAVAGRNLYTCKGKNKISRVSFLQPINKDEIKQIELSAVQNALEIVSEAGKETEYYCVGYSVTEYKLDNENIRNLLDHRGREIEVEVLVTLLPHKVLESLFTVLQQAGLELSYLTLEPIAALELVVPKDMYYMELVLIDIGAGTSDIAIISSNKVIVYGMVPHAGDNITEAISKEFLIDFKESERMKRTFQQQDRILYTDIFGRENNKQIPEIYEKIRPAVKELACNISEEIKRLISSSCLNQNFAVILVGGGSLTPFIEGELSNSLNITSERIGVRAAKLSNQIIDETGKLLGPDSATPLGIAILSLKQEGLSLVHLTINGTRRTLIKVGEKQITVLSALLFTGVSIRQIYGMPGLAKTFTLNSELKTIKGSSPTSAIVKVNDTDATFDTELKECDRIDFYPAADGLDGIAKIKDIMSVTKKIKFNEKEIFIFPQVFMNNKEVTADTEIPDRAELRTREICDIKDFLKHEGYNIDFLSEKTISVYVNGEIIIKTAKNYMLVVNNNEITLADEWLLNSDDIVKFEIIEPVWYVKDFVSEPENGSELRIKINGEEYIFHGAKGKILVNSEETDLYREVRNNDIIRTYRGKDAEAILVDVFQHIAIDPQDKSGKRIKLLINDTEAQFTSPLFNDADVRVLFE